MIASMFGLVGSAFAMALALFFAVCGGFVLARENPDKSTVGMMLIFAMAMAVIALGLRP
jgi:hypothetical protein